LKFPKNLSELKVYELKTIAKSLGHPSPSKLNKKELISYIQHNKQDVKNPDPKKYKFYKDFRFIVPIALSIFGIWYASNNNRELKEQVKENKQYLEEVQMIMPDEFKLNLDLNFQIPKEIQEDYQRNKEDWIYNNLKYVHFNIDLNTKEYTSLNNLPALQIITKYQIKKEFDKKYIESSWLEKHHQFKLYDSGVNISLHRIPTSGIFNDGEVKSIKEFCGNNLLIRSDLEFGDNQMFTERPKANIRKGSMTTPDGKTLRFDIERSDWALSTDTKSDSCWMYIRKKKK